MFDPVGVGFSPAIGPWVVPRALPFTSLQDGECATRSPHASLASRRFRAHLSSFWPKSTVPFGAECGRPNIGGPKGAGMAKPKVKPWGGRSAPGPVLKGWHHVRPGWGRILAGHRTLGFTQGFAIHVPLGRPPPQRSRNSRASSRRVSSLASFSRLSYAVLPLPRPTLTFARPFLK